MADDKLTKQAEERFQTLLDEYAFLAKEMKVSRLGKEVFDGVSGCHHCN